MTLSQPSKTHRLQFYSLLLLSILLAFALRVHQLDFQSLWRDEVDAIRFSDGTTLALLKALPHTGHNGPLYFAALHNWRTLTGDSEFALRYLSVLGSMLAVAMSFRLAVDFGWRKSAGLMVVLLMAASPYLIWYSQEAKMYSWLVFLVLLAIFSFRQALKSEHSAKWWLVFVISASFSFYTHILSPLMLGVYLLWAALDWQHIKKHWRGASLSLAVLVLPYLPLLRWQFPLLQAGFASGHPFYPLTKEIDLLLHFYSAGILRQTIAPYLIGVMSFLVLLGLFHKKTSLSSRLKLLLWLSIPAFLVYFISLRVHVFEDRYLIYLAPAFYMSAASGIDALFRWRKWLGTLIIIGLMAANARAVVKQNTSPIKADFRSVANFIAQAEDNPAPAPNPPSAIPNNLRFHIFLPLISHENTPVVMFQMPYLQYTFDYYFDGDYRQLEGTWTNDGKSDAQVDEILREQLADVQSLWLVVAEEDAWDNRHLLRHWLNLHGTLQNEGHFVGADVYFYQLHTFE